MNDISIFYLLNLALRRLWALFLAGIIFTSGAYAYCKFLATPSYSAKASVLVTNGSIISEADSPDNSVTVTDISASLSLANTIADVLQASGIFKTIAEDIDNQYSYRQLMGMSTIQRRNNMTMVVDVTFSTSDPNESIRLANIFVKTAPEYIMEVIPYSNAIVLSEADVASKTYPRTLTTSLFVGLVGAVLAFAVVFIIDFFDQAIKGEEDFKVKFDIPIIGIVPDFENAGVTTISKGR